MNEHVHSVYGIDPGISGAIALIEYGQVIERPLSTSIWDMPTRVTSQKKVKGKIVRKSGVDTYKARGIFAGQPKGIVYLEKVHAMPGRDEEGQATRSMGATSAFNFGMSFGMILAVAEVAIGRVELVTPQAWKKHFGLIGKDKVDSLHLARELFPSLTGILGRKKDIGRAEALLIAQYGIHLEQEKHGNAIT